MKGKKDELLQSLFSQVNRIDSKEHPKGEKWNKETVLKVFADAGHPTSNARYSENGVYYAMNMVYSDFFPMYKDDVSKYVEHAYLFLNDKDYKGKYSKEKWYAKKGLDFVKILFL